MSVMEAATMDRLEMHSARRYLYALGQALRGGEPTAERLAAVDDGLVAEAAAVLGLPDTTASEFVRALAAARADVPEACAAYTTLFIGPAAPKALAWESTYRSLSKALFRQETLEVRNAYRAQGFLPASYPKVADDHIALELGFLAALAGNAAEALQAADEAGAADAVAAASLQFLNDHLLTWIDDYAADLSAAAVATTSTSEAAKAPAPSVSTPVPATLYPALIHLVAALAHRDRQLLG